MSTPPHPDLSTTLSTSPATFLQPTPTLHSTTIAHAKSILDPLAAEIAQAQDERERAWRQDKTRKRKRGNAEYEEFRLQRERRIRGIWTHGFEVEQVWQQAKVVIEDAVVEVERALVGALGKNSGSEAKSVGDGVNGHALGQDGDEDIGGSSVDEVDMGSDEVDWEDEGDSEDMEDMDDAPNGVSLTNGIEDDIDFSEDDDAEEQQEDVLDDSEASDDLLGAASPEELKKDKHGLNDGFFSIDQFNKQTQFLEAQDARGDPDDGRASDEESVDWNAEPQSVSQIHTQTRKDKSGKKVELSEDEDENVDDEGPAPFGNMDLNAPEGDSEDEDLDAADADLDMDDLNAFSNTNDIKYEDFFAPPAQQKKKKQQSAASREKRAPGRASNKGLATEHDATTNSKLDDDEYSDTSIQRAMSNVRHDLFSSASPSLSRSSSPTSTHHPKQPQHLSNHEKRQSALRAEIARLEAENIAAKPWTLTGETLAPARPLNSLLAEDLDFERAGKPIPLPTAETDEDIEHLIKRRILARDFDEVIRRRPTDVNNPTNTPNRGILPLDDSKPAESLAQTYEASLLALPSAQSEAQKAVQEEISAQWKDLAAQLDALSNWHYKPAPPAASISVRSDAPVVLMEDARPGGVGGAVGGMGGSALAPQEVFSVSGGEKGKAGEKMVLPRGSTALIHREEESKDASRRRRRREKARVRKANANKPVAGKVENGVGGNGAGAGAGAGAGTDGQVKGKRKSEREKEQGEVVRQLSKGGVKVIGRKGQLEGIDAKGAVKKGRSEGTKLGVGGYKL